MAALEQFYHQSFRWYLAGYPGKCGQARNGVHRRQKDRFGPELVARHWHQTTAILERADFCAQQDADYARWLRMQEAIDHERKAA